MIEFEVSILIERAPQEVFRYVSNLENLPTWNYFVIDVKATSGTKPRVGATYHQTRRTDRQDLRIVEFDEGRLLTVETIPASKPELVRRMKFHEKDGMTQIVDHWRLNTGHPAILQKLAAGRVRSGVKDNLDKLKELPETGATTLQDGRNVLLPRVGHLQSRAAFLFKFAQLLSMHTSSVKEEGGPLTM
jgi:uncharacterized membrane protein